MTNYCFCYSRGARCVVPSSLDVHLLWSVVRGVSSIVGVVGDILLGAATSWTPFGVDDTV